MPTGPGLNRNLKHLEGGVVSSLELTLTLPTPPGGICTVVYDCGITAKVGGNISSLAVKQGSAFLALDSSVNNDPASDEVRMSFGTSNVPFPWLAFGTPNTGLTVVAVFLTSLTSGTIFCVFEEVPVT